MADQTQRLEIATVKAEIGSDILSRFSNDAVTAAPIPTDSGNIQNLKQVIVSIQEDGAEKISFASTIYSTTSAGIAATTNGAIFLVKSDEADEIYAVWQNVSGVATDTGKRSMAAQAIQDAMQSATEAAQAAEDSADLATARTARFLASVSTPPVIRDDGTPLQLGDRYVNAENQAEYIYKSSGWVVNDSLEAIADIRDETDPDKGAAQVGWDGETVGAQLDQAKKLANYTALGNYTGTATRIELTQSGIAGPILRDPTVTVGDGGTTFLDGMGRGWRRIYDGAVYAKWFGAKVDGASNDTSAVHAAIDSLAASGGGFIDIGPGTMMVSGITHKDKVYLLGSGKGVTTIKLIAGSNAHVIQGGDFDTNADGVVKATPLGCRSAGIYNLTIDGNKTAQTQAKHGLALYGIDLSIFGVEAKNCKGWGVYTESPGGTFSIVAGQNLQHSVTGIEAHHNDLGNFFYNGQSDSNLSDIMCYECGGDTEGQANLKIGSKGTGVRLVGGHCWGVSAYGVINEADCPEFSDFHVESATVAKVWAKDKITWTGGHIYEAGTKTSAVGFKLDKDYNNIRGVRATNIRGGLLDTSAGGVAGNNSVVEVYGYTAAAGSILSVGTIPTNSDIELRLFGLTVSSLFQRSQKLTTLGGISSPGHITASGGLDMSSSGIDRANYIAGQGWAAVAVVAGVLSVATSFVVLNEASPVNVTDILSTAGQLGILELTIRNSGASAVTFAHNTAKLRNNSAANIVLSQHQSVKYTLVSGSIWQQTGGKV